MLEREVKLGRDTSILRVESGLGASGIPHVGSLGDAVRAYGVKLALQDLGSLSTLRILVSLPSFTSRSNISEPSLSIHVPRPIFFSKPYTMSLAMYGPSILYPNFA